MHTLELEYQMCAFVTHTRIEFRLIHVNKVSLEVKYTIVWMQDEIRNHHSKNQCNAEASKRSHSSCMNSDSSRSYYCNTNTEHSINFENWIMKASNSNRRQSDLITSYISPKIGPSEEIYFHIYDKGLGLHEGARVQVHEIHNWFHKQ